MSDLFYDRDGTSYWKCGRCGQEREHPRAGGAYVKVGNIVVAIVCEDPCLNETLEALPGFLSNRAALAGTTP